MRLLGISTKKEELKKEIDAYKILLEEERAKKIKYWEEVHQLTTDLAQHKKALELAIDKFLSLVPPMLKYDNIKKIEIKGCLDEAIHFLTK